MSHHEEKDPREMWVAVLSSLLVAAVFLYTVWGTYLSPTVYELTIDEVFSVQHPNGIYTTIDTVGQGRYSFTGVYDFKEGRSYRLRFMGVPTPFGKYRLLSWFEVSS